MRNRILYNIAVLIIVGVLFMAVAMVTYMGVRAYGIGRDAKVLNGAVETSANISELAAASSSESDFVSRVDKNIGKVSYIKGSYDLNGKSDTIIKIKVKTKDRQNGTMMDVDVVTYSGSKEIYSVSTQKYFSSREVGDAS